jgi:hypothetical protein
MKTRGYSVVPNTAGLEAFPADPFFVGAVCLAGFLFSSGTFAFE